MMKRILATGAVCLLSACSGPIGILPEAAVEVTESRVKNFLAPDGEVYDMRTYVVPSQEPFFITVHPQRRTFAFEHDHSAAGSAASSYIRTRGCTGTLSRLSRQDVYSAADTAWTIAIQC